MLELALARLIASRRVQCCVSHTPSLVSVFVLTTNVEPNVGGGGGGSVGTCASAAPAEAFNASAASVSPANPWNSPRLSGPVKRFRGRVDDVVKRPS